MSSTIACHLENRQLSDPAVAELERSPIRERVLADN